MRRHHIVGEKGKPPENDQINDVRCPSGKRFDQCTANGVAVIYIRDDGDTPATRSLVIYDTGSVAKNDPLTS